MQILKTYTVFLYSAILALAVYLVYVFVNVHYNPNHVMKDHHDYSFNGYLIAMIVSGFWLTFVSGLFQVKLYLQGKDRLFVATFLFGALILYLLFIIIGSSSSPDPINYFFVNCIVIMLLSGVMLIFGWSGYAKKIHLEFKAKNYDSLRQKLGI